MLFNTLYYGNCAGDPVFRSDFRPQVGCALAHRLICYRLFDGLREPLGR